jgi:murein endopeptidase
MVETLAFDAQKKVFLQAMKSDQVEFILIYPDLKKALCGDAYKAGVFNDPESNSESIKMLTHLIPDDGHHDHFHVRLKCDPLIHPLCKIHLGEEPTKHGCIFKKSTGK